MQQSKNVAEMQQAPPSVLQKAPPKPPRLLGATKNVILTDATTATTTKSIAVKPTLKTQRTSSKKQLQFKSPLLSEAGTARTLSGAKRQQTRLWPHNQRQIIAKTNKNIVTTKTSTTKAADPVSHTALKAKSDSKAKTVDMTVMSTRVIAMPSSNSSNITTTATMKTTAKSASTSSSKLATTATMEATKNRLVLGCTSLMYACQHGDAIEVLNQLHTKPEAIRQRDSRNKNALHYCAAQNVQETRDLVAAASIAIAAPELLESADEDGFTPLHLAVIQGNLAMVNLLLANKADVNAVDNEGHSVVHWATVCGEIEAMRAVLAAGANVVKPDINGGTPLHYAAQMCGASYESKLGQTNSTKLALEILDILLAHPQCSVDVQDKDGRQPLLWAASAGSAKALMALVKAGARVESADKDGLTALHCAASRGHTECIDTLISLCGAPTDLIDSNGCTALHYAVTLGHADATARLLDLEADPNRQDRKGRTPAHCGCSKGQFETLKLLKERGANLWLRNAKGDLPIHEAASSGRRELVEWLLEQRPKQVNTTSNDGRSMFHIAAANDYTDMCKMLLDYGGDINALYRNSKGLIMTPLDCALQRGHRSTAKFLQSNGGLPSNKLRLAARRANPFREATADMVRPLKYAEKEEIHDLRNSKKYVVYLKRSDSDGGDENCSCTEQTYRKEQHYEHICRRHKRRHLRRRTSSCGEQKHVCPDDGCSDICRSKSNIELRRRKSRERCSSSSDWDDEDDEDSCENCCYHKRQKQRVLHKKRASSLKRSKESEDERKSGERGIRDLSTLEKSVKTLNGSGKDQQVEIMQERQRSGSSKSRSSTKRTHSRPQSATSRKTPPTSATKKDGTFIKSPPQTATSENVVETKVLPEDSHTVELTDEEVNTRKSAELVTTQVDVHHDAEEPPMEKPVSDETQQKDDDSTELKITLSDEETKEISKEVEQVIKIAATALNSESKSSSLETAVATEPPKVEDEAKHEIENVNRTEDNSAPTADVSEQPQAAETIELESKTQQLPENSDMSKTEEVTQKLGTIETKEELLNKAAETTESAELIKQQVEGAQSISTEPHTGETQQPQQAQQAQQTPPSKQQTPPQQREQESRRSFTLLPSDSADDEPRASGAEEPERKSSFQVLKSDESVGDADDPKENHDVEFSDSQVFKIVDDDSSASKLHSDMELSSPQRSDAKAQKVDYEYEEYEDDADEVNLDGDAETLESHIRRFVSSGNRHGVAATDGTSIAGVYEINNGRKRRLKKRVRSGAKTRSNWKQAQETRESTGAAAISSKDQDSGFEPSPRATKSKIPTPRNSYTAYMPRRPIYATLDGRSCSSRLEHRKPGDKTACDMAAVTRSIQRNIRRYYMERKIFQHLLELKSLQIRSNKLNEAVLVKRAVDDYHQSCITLGGETGTRLRRYSFTEYTFKNFELFLYETLKGLQKPGTYNFQNINEVYEEAERRLSPDYNAYEKALQCTTKTHRCLHAAHAYTGIPCAAYIPMMNHHTMPKFGFGPYKKTSVSSFYLPKILTSGSCGGTRGKCGGGGGVGKVALELSHGKSKQLISLPSEKLDSNKRYYVTFTVKESGTGTTADASFKQYYTQQQQQASKTQAQQQKQDIQPQCVGNNDDEDAAATNATVA